MGNRKERHILALSGGKDSAALAVYMQEKYPELPLEYVFIDSGYELPETMEYIDRIRAVLNISILPIGGASIKDRKDFKWWLNKKNNYLPSPQKRWCTDILKLRPYNEWIDKNCSGQAVHSYVGLRADEKTDRKGNLSGREFFYQHHPFIEHGLDYQNIKDLLESSGLGFPSYYKWRSRSGCYFCFYQTKREWLGLLKHHKELFWKAAAMEKTDPETGTKFTWCDDMSLEELEKNKKIILTEASLPVQGKKMAPGLITTISSLCKKNLSDPKLLIRR
ncbi:phosphoadenosine phosphosulfate reductase family protein [uncultured Desulfobacter sp.]|uniref:phosphoadenosine phosphosulfate reductase family protein n=1 Tax=uncultured Desulfobacter sp. TaxID=240139 RepID=UPI002AAB42D6|nr:phosphoadenosine phosphosulfate reductase family protein [uncultured Desulfobacter sp.]